MTYMSSSEILKEVIALVEKVFPEFRDTESAILAHQLAIANVLSLINMDERGYNLRERFKQFNDSLEERL